MRNVLFPYATVPDAESVVSVSSIRLDGAVCSLPMYKENSTVCLYEHRGSWQRAELDLEFTCDPERLRSFESEHAALSVVVVANCLPTNFRLPVRLSRSNFEVGRWSGTLEMDRDNVRDRVGLSTTLTATVGGIPHRPVAVAPEWTVHADEPESLRVKGTLQVKWLNFTTLDAPLPASAFPKSTHVLAFTKGMPELWLNSGFDGLEMILKDRKDRRGEEKGLHDFQRTGIARAVWLAMIADALSAVRADAADEGASEPDWPERPWQAEILKLVLHQVAPGKSDRELLGMASRDWREHPGAGEFFARAEAVVGDIVKANESIRRFVQSYHGEE